LDLEAPFRRVEPLRPGRYLSSTRPSVVISRGPLSPEKDARRGLYLMVSFVRAATASASSPPPPVTKIGKPLRETELVPTYSHARSPLTDGRDRLCAAVYLRCFMIARPRFFRGSFNDIAIRVIAHESKGESVVRVRMKPVDHLSAANDGTGTRRIADIIQS
jgi:hypothetical protein